ncbi:bifunctional alpha/beta hydrolase/OsmC family protein [Nonomuraea dietziae]|uniref:bifunctional alpha/beta hydrolase/OsmC family protein n=1 Tax=Nonomuraea dietziae TaxID=65515 RepID=UPI0033CDA772
MGQGGQIRSERVTFTGSAGIPLAGRLELPEGPPRAVALFAHCFACGKDVHAASHIARGLAGLGIAVLRFDFTGLGQSGGDFGNTDFTSTIEDLVRAADHLRATLAPPALLIGHSLGGAAILAAAERIQESRAVVTIGAPADPSHVAGLFPDAPLEVETTAAAEVSLAGRRFRVSRAFLDDIASQPQRERIANLRRALLVMHAPTDAIVGVDHARTIFEAARHPKSFVSLDGADHLLSADADSAYAATVIAAWASRYVDAPAAPPSEQPDGVVEVREVGRYTQEITAGRHRLTADEPLSVGGADAGPTPYDLLLAALGGCTSMTIRMYADRKRLPLQGVTVRLRHRRIHAKDCADCETEAGTLDKIEREILLEGPLDEEQRRRLLEIADKCPVHRTLTSEVVIETVEAPGDS